MRWRVYTPRPFTHLISRVDISMCVRCEQLNDIIVSCMEIQVNMHLILVSQLSTSIHERVGNKLEASQWRSTCARGPNKSSPSFLKHRFVMGSKQWERFEWNTAAGLSFSLSQHPTPLLRTLQVICTCSIDAGSKASTISR